MSGKLDFDFGGLVKCHGNYILFLEVRLNVREIRFWRLGKCTSIRL